MMNWIAKSLFRRLLVSYLITILLGLGVVGISISLFTKSYMYNVTQEELLRKAKKVNQAIQDTSVIDENTIELLAFLDQTFDARIWIFNRDGKFIATSMKDEVYIGKSVDQSIVKQVITGHDVVKELKFEGLTKPMISVVVPWGKKDQLYGGIVLHAPIEGLNKTFGYMREAILWATLFGVLLSTAMVSYLSWSISRPLQKIDRTAVEIGMGHYHQRVQIENPDEIGELAQTINTLAEKLERVELERTSAEQVRSDFLANISHELRTPLTAMQGFLEALQDGLVEEEESKQKYLNVMYQETLHLNRLVDDLTMLIKLENKELPLFKTAVDVGEVIDKVAFSFQQEAAEKNISLQLQIDSELPKVLADRHRLIQILSNLLQNAVKFTQDGKIEVMAVQEAQQVRIDVADTGIGIAEEDLERIWERFFKSDRVRSRNVQGTGLGLAIVKELVELHQGTIQVQSQFGSGTTFSVWLPIADHIFLTNG